MPVSVERFIRALTSTGIMTAADADSLAQSVPAEKRAADADELARDLVRQGKLTKFQAAAIYQDKADGLLLGNYLILDKLGAGGMGQVFRARHRRMDRVVAIKVLSKKLLDSPDAVARFQREAKAAARLTHPNIVTAYDADEAGGMHFLVMEYVDGSDLAGVVKQHGPLPVGQGLDYLLQAARGLEHAHGEGVVHRDIKPSNLLLDKKGTLKILDMGLARMSDPLADPNARPGADLTHSGSIMGTIDYMAPEQAMDSRQADARSDIYSLGCTLHYLLTARPPYSGDTILKRLTAHQQTAIPMLSTTRPDIPPGVQEVFGRMMAKPPGGRFQTAKELVAALDSLRNQPVSSRPVPIPVQPIAVQPIAAQPMAAVAGTPSSTGMKDLESIMLPGIERGSRTARKSSSKAPLVGVTIVLLLAAAGTAAWKLSRPKPDETARSEPAPTTDVQQPSTISPPAAVAESKPIAEPENEPQPAAAPPETMPDKSEPAANAAPQGAPPVAAPGVTEVVSTTTAPASPPVASPAEPQASPLPAEQPAADAKLPVPGVEAQRESRKLLTEVYKDDYAQTKQPDAKVALAEKLLNELQQAKDDTTALYVMLHEVRDLAVEAANPELAERAIGMLTARYAVDPLKELAAALDEMAGKSHPADVSRAIAEAALARVEEAQANDDFDSARRLADAAQVAARKAKDPNLSKRAIEVVKSVTAAKLQWEAWHKAQATLEQTPDDPAANLAVGRYLCLVQGDWDGGLVHLAKGPDGPLKDLAARSLKPPEDAAALADLGDAWFSAAEKAKGKERADLRAGAAYWYTQAEPGVTGLVKSKIEKRLADLGGKVAVRAAVVAEMPPANGLWYEQTFDCNPQAHPLSLGPGFDIAKSWTLALEAQFPNLDAGNHLLFYWGDFRSGRNPMAISHDGAVLHAWITDCNTNRAHDLQVPLNAGLVGPWVRMVVRFEAPTNELAVYLNGQRMKQERASVIPAVDRPMTLFVGGEAQKSARFLGQVRNIWLGNQDKFTLVNSKSLAAAAPRAQPKPGGGSTGPGMKLSETTELVLAPGVNMKLRLIPAGSFAMGRPGNKGNFFEHTVNITQPFYLGVTEVTQAQWQAVMGNNPSEKKGNLAWPVDTISWNDCQSFLQRLNQSPLAKSVRFRLPTEAEWEYACYAGKKTEYGFGDDVKQLPEYGWFKDNSGGVSHPVALLKPNAWGLYDMHGNCFEWCNDWYDVDYYRHSPDSDPTGPSTGENRVLRGGARSAAVEACYATTRRPMPPDAAEGIFSVRLVCQPKALLASAARSTMAAGGTSAGGRKPVAFAQADLERQVANWVLSIGGKVKVVSPAAPHSNPVEIGSAAQLPPEPFVVFGIDLYENKTVTDNDLARFDNLSNLVELKLIGTALGDELLKHAALHRKLIELHLNRTKITDDGLAAIENMTSLQTLFLMRTQISDAGLAHLRRLTQLRSLGFQETQVTDAGLASVAGLGEMRWLGASGNKITDAGVKQLAQLRLVTALELMDLKITDAGLLPLTGLPELQILFLQRTPITDTGLETLAGIPSLTKLHLAGSQVTDAGVQKFKTARPKCEVIR